MHIHDNLMVSDVQGRFAKCFPSLKIEFYSKAHTGGRESSEKDLIDPTKRIGEIRRNKNEGCLEIKSWYPVAKVEKEFRKLFGLNIQVFRKENGSWVQTSKTDKFSLWAQSKLADKAEDLTAPKCKEQLGEYGYL